MIVAKPSDWLSEEPRALLDRSIESYGEALRGAEEVGPEHLRKADYAFRHQVVRLLVRAAEEEELAAASEAMRSVLPLDLEDAYPEWSARWLGFSDLLEARLAALRSRTPGAARALRHADEILAHVEANPGDNQAAIADVLRLGAANLSRILGVLEAHELIERREVGREKLVYVGRLFEPVEAAEEEGEMVTNPAALSPSESTAVVGEKHRPLAFLLVPEPRKAA